MYLTTKRIIALILSVAILHCALISSYALREEELDSDTAVQETQDVLPEEEDPFTTSRPMYYPDPMMLFEELAETAVFDDGTEDVEETEETEYEEEIEESARYYTPDESCVEYDWTDDGWGYTIHDNRTATLHGCYDHEESTLIVPETIKGCPVVEIAAYAFIMLPTAVEIVIPGTVKYIGKLAFAEMPNLKSVTMSEGTVCIDGQAFWSSSLEELHLPASLLWMSPDAVELCKSLRRITVNEGGESYCDVDGVLYSKDMTTLYCYPPMYGEQHFTVPESVTSLVSYAVALNPTLETVTLPAGLTDLGEFWTFGKDTALKEIVIPEGVREIPYCCFSECRSLKSVELPQQMDAIGEHAFSECYSLQSIVIPDGVTELPYCCFFYCVSLQTMSLPNRNIKFGKDAIWECPNLGLLVRS